MSPEFGPDVFIGRKILATRSRRFGRPKLSPLANADVRGSAPRWRPCARSRPYFDKRAGSFFAPILLCRSCPAARRARRDKTLDNSLGFSDPRCGEPRQETTEFAPSRAPGIADVGRQYSTISHRQKVTGIIARLVIRVLFLFELLSSGFGCRTPLAPLNVCWPHSADLMPPGNFPMDNGSGFRSAKIDSAR